MSDLYATPVAQQYPHRPSDGIGQLVGIIKTQSEKIREATSNLLGSAGIRLKPGRMIVEQSLDVEGELTVTGNTVIEGTLSLPAGIIDNDALASPLGVGNASARVTNFAVPAAATVQATGSTTVPPGFTRAIVDCTASAGAVNTLAVNYMWVAATIQGVAGYETTWGNNPTSTVWVSGTSRKVAILEGLTGGQSITVGVQTRQSSSTTWAANTSNYAFADALVFFLR